MKTQSVLQRLAVFSRNHYRWVFALFAALLVFAGFLASRLKLDTDVLNLLPRKDPVINTYMETLQDFGTFDYLMITLRIPPGAPVDPYTAYADALAERVGALEQVERVEYRIGDVNELLETFFPQAVLFLDEEGREALAQRLSPEGIEIRAQELRRLISTPQSLVMRDLIKLDPFGLAEILMDRLESGQGAMAIDWASGYFLSHDHELLLVLAKPIKPPQDIEFDRGLVAGVEAAIADTDSEWAELSAGMATAAPQVNAGGAYVTALQDAGLIQQDMTVNMASSMALVLLLFLFAFRRFGLLAYAFIPLAAGLILTFGFSSAVFGSLSSATSGTAALLIGLGIDFIIVSYGRFVEERNQGAGLEEALATTMGSSGRAVVVGAVTTAATFYAFTFTDFRGLRQMGILTGTGILLCMVAVLLLLPAMLAWSHDRHAKRSSRPRLFLHSFGTDRLMRLCLNHPRPVLLAGLVFTLVTAFAVPRLEFQDNWREMRPAGNRGVAVEKEVAEHFDSDFDFMMLVLEGQDLNALLEKTETVTTKAQALVKEGVLNGVTSVSSILPSPRRQQEALDWLRDGKQQGGVSYPEIEERFLRTLAAEGMNPQPFDRGLSLLRQALELESPLELSEMPADGQTQRLLDRVLHRRGDGWKSVVYLYPPAEIYRRQAPEQAVALAAELGDGVVLTGANVVNERMRLRVRRDAWLAALLGTLAVWLLLWFDFRHLRASILALTPLLIGITWMLGLMTFFGIAMNFMNIFATTMVIGIGVDYGLHMVHRYREFRLTPGLELEKGLVETGNAIVVAALSTVAGFGSLSLSHYPGLRSTGYVAIIGAVATALVAITLLPAYLSLRMEKRRTEPSSSRLLKKT